MKMIEIASISSVNVKKLGEKKASLQAFLQLNH